MFYCWGLLVHHKRASSLLQKNFYSLFTFFNLGFKVFCILHFLAFSFHCQSTMNVSSEDLFMNGMIEDGEGFLISVTNYGVSIIKTKPHWPIYLAYLLGKSLDQP